jgi:hypothetical protein
MDPEADGEVVDGAGLPGEEGEPTEDGGDETGVEPVVV